MILALLPLARAGWIERVVADLKVGSSEAGASSSESSHHPERSRAMRTFAPVGHRHQAEVCEQLDLSEDAVFVTVTAVEAVRGVLATCHVFLAAAAEVDEKAVWRLYRETYAGEPFVRLVNQRRGLHRLPDPKVLLGSNYCDVGFRLDGRGRRLVALAAIDNLVKGAAGSALQSLNVARGFAENEGLDFPGLHPV
jgi:N-acetyl-gamma-glutamyl-phosphate/LysW-gamma-L-alpha-aminoadipyl-6-phosphate reductase